MTEDLLHSRDDCRACPPGSACNGSSIVIPCPPGKFQDEKGSLACKPCGDDTLYQPSYNATQCLRCTQDSFTDGGPSNPPFEHTRCLDCGVDGICNGSSIILDNNNFAISAQIREQDSQQYMIYGIVGGLIAAIIAVVIVIVVLKKRKKQKEQRKERQQNGMSLKLSQIMPSLDMVPDAEPPSEESMTGPSTAVHKPKPTKITPLEEDNGEAPEGKTPKSTLDNIVDPDFTYAKIAPKVPKKSSHRKHRRRSHKKSTHKKSTSDSKDTHTKKKRRASRKRPPSISKREPEQFPDVPVSQVADVPIPAPEEEVPQRKRPDAPRIARHNSRSATIKGIHNSIVQKEAAAKRPSPITGVSPDTALDTSGIEASLVPSQTQRGATQNTSRRRRRERRQSTRHEQPSSSRRRSKSSSSSLKKKSTADEFSENIVESACQTVRL